MRTLVINLTRFGDLLQTQPVLTGLKEQGDTVGLVCLQNFRQATPLLGFVDCVFDIPGARLLAGLDVSWPVALNEFLAWIEQVKNFTPQRVINLTPSLSARLAARATEAGQSLGFAVDELGFGVASTPWAAFLEASALHRGSSPFNVVDLFRRAAHLPPAQGRFSLAAPDAAILARVDAVIASQAPPAAAGFVGFQLGASAEMRRWPVESFAFVAEAVWREHNLLPVLLGSPDEAGLADAFARATSVPHVNLVGGTNLVELAAVVSRLRVLVSNDTGTLHLAAGLGTPVLGIFLATAQPWDTGPYSPGACSLEPDMACHPCAFSQECPRGWACRHHVRPRAVLHFLDHWLRNGSWPCAEGLGVRVWLAEVDAHGYLDQRSLTGHGDSERAAWNAVQRTFWRQFLDAESVVLPSEAAQALPEALRAALREPLAQALGLLELLQQQARLMQAAPNTALRNKFMAGWQRLESVLNGHPNLRILGHLWLRLTQDDSADLTNFVQVASRTASLVSALSAAVSSQP